MSLKVEEVEEAEEVVAGVAVVAAVVVARGGVVAAAAPRAVVAAVTVVVVGKAVAAAAMEIVKVVAVEYGSLKVLEEVIPLAGVANLHTSPRTIQVLQAILSSSGK